MEQNTTSYITKKYSLTSWRIYGFEMEKRCLKYGACKRETNFVFQFCNSEWNFMSSKRIIFSSLFILDSLCLFIYNIND